MVCRIVLGLTLAAAAAVAVLAQQQGERRDAAEGMFTVEQADRGRQTYLGRCAGCHGSDLSGGEFEGDDVPALKRDDFLTGTDAGSVFGRIKRLMPRDAPGSLDDARYVDVLAFLLRENGFPPGASELPVDPDGLAAIRLTKRMPAPNFSLVRVVGCLSSEGRSRRLTGASEPQVTARDTATAEDLVEARAEPEGSAAFALTGPSGSLPNEPGRAEVIGLLIRGVGEDRLNVVSIQMLGVPCAG